MRNFLSLAIGFLLGAALFSMSPHSRAFSADLPLPKPRTAAVNIPVSLPERCLITGENPDPGQTLHVDKRCKSGLRWVYEH